MMDSRYNNVSVSSLQGASIKGRLIKISDFFFSISIFCGLSPY